MDRISFLSRYTKFLYFPMIKNPSTPELAIAGRDAINIVKI